MVYKSSEKSFTLIELLIVIGILGVLIVTVLVALNPLEAQRKARDAKRMKDMSTYQAIFTQYFSEGGVAFCTGSCNTTSAPAGADSQPCDSNWTGANFCKYAKTVPVEPMGTLRTFILTPANGVLTPVTKSGSFQLYYLLVVSGGDYKLGALMESESSANNVSNDGGNYPYWAEFASSSTAMTTFW